MKKKIIFLAISIMCIFVSMKPVVAESYTNYDPDSIVSCGRGMITDIPRLIPAVISVVYTIIQVAVPVVLVIMGTLDLFKGISAQKEDEIKKGQQIFVKRLITAALVFFVFVIVKIVVSFVADGSGINIMKCAECFINEKCDRDSDFLPVEGIIRSIRGNFDIDGTTPEFVAGFRAALISIVDEDFSGSDEELIKEIERRLNDGDDELREELINFLYYDL